MHTLSVISQILQSVLTGSQSFLTPERKDAHGGGRCRPKPAAELEYFDKGRITEDRSKR